MIAIWWVRRDLRLADNQAFKAAQDYADTIIPAFILDPTLLAAPNLSDKRLALPSGGLRSLDADLRARGSRLIVRRGVPADELPWLAGETGATAICAEDDPWPYARRRDAGVAERLPLRLSEGVAVFPSDSGAGKLTADRIPSSPLSAGRGGRAAPAGRREPAGCARPFGAPRPWICSACRSRRRRGCLPVVPFPPRAGRRR